MTLELFTAIGALVGGSSRSSSTSGSSRRCSRSLLVYVAITMLRRPRAGDAAPAPTPRTPSASRAPRPVAEPARPRRRRLSARDAAGSRLLGSAACARDRRRSAPASSRRCSASAAGSSRCPVMHVAMGVPLRVATATSNLMIGITAVGERDHLPAPRRDRPVRRRPDGDRRVRRRDDRVAGRRTGSTCGILRWLFVVVLALHGVPDARQGARMTAGHAARAGRCATSNGMIGADS